MDEKKKRGQNLPVVLFFGAVALIAVGLWMWSVPVALIFLGVVLLYLGVCTSAVSAQNKRQ